MYSNEQDEIINFQNSNNFQMKGKLLQSKPDYLNTMKIIKLL